MGEWSVKAVQPTSEPVSVSRIGLGMQDGFNCMTETNPSKENTTEQKRPRWHYDAKF